MVKSRVGSFRGHLTQGLRTMPPHQPVQTYSDDHSLLAWQPPPGACDTHVHVFGPATRFAYSSSSNLIPVDAPKEKLFALHRRLGITRCVIVQSMVHGLDNRVVSDAIAAGGGCYLGVALVNPEIALADLQALAQAGFRGVRFNFTAHLGSGIDPQAIPAFTERLAQAGLHLQVHFASARIHDLSAPLLQSQVPVVIDHMGRVDARLGIDQPDVRQLCTLLETGRFHVKVSGIDRVDALLPLAQPPYPHGTALARHLVERFSQRCLWGTDWPHPNHTHIPDDGVLINAVLAIAPNPADRQALLVDNPQALYQFPEHQRA